MKKIFEIEHEDGEKEWVTGDTNIGALLSYLQTTGCDIVDIEDAKISELPKSKWGKFKVKQEDEEEMTFAKWMKLYGKGHNDIIAGTMYEV